MSWTNQYKVLSNGAGGNDLGANLSLYPGEKNQLAPYILPHRNFYNKLHVTLKSAIFAKVNIWNVVQCTLKIIL